MGQYFKYGLSNGKEAISATFAKMTEHSYIFNEAVSMLYYLLADESYKDKLNVKIGELLGAWRNKKVYHCGDYSEKKVGKKDLYEVMCAKAEAFMCHLQQDILGRIVSSGSRFNAPDDVFADSLERLFEGMPLYVLNHTKKVFIDVRAQIFIHRVLESEKPGEVYGMFDPLSLLLVETDGSGGGDYGSEYEEWVGTWSGDKIEVVSSLPMKAAKYEDQTIDFYFSEEGHLFDNGRLSRDNRGKIYQAYASGFGRVEKKTGGGSVIVSGVFDSGSQDEVVSAFNNLVMTTLATFNLTFESKNGVVEAEIVNIINGVLSVATVDQDFNYQRLGEIKPQKGHFRIGDVVKVKRNPLELVA